MRPRGCICVVLTTLVQFWNTNGHAQAFIGSHYSVWGSFLAHLLRMGSAKVLVRLCICAVSPELSPSITSHLIKKSTKKVLLGLQPAKTWISWSICTIWIEPLLFANWHQFVAVTWPWSDLLATCLDMCNFTYVMKSLHKCRQCGIRSTKALRNFKPLQVKQFQGTHLMSIFTKSMDPQMARLFFIDTETTPMNKVKKGFVIMWPNSVWVFTWIISQYQINWPMTWENICLR